MKLSERFEGGSGADPKIPVGAATEALSSPSGHRAGLALRAFPTRCPCRTNLAPTKRSGPGNAEPRAAGAQRAAAAPSRSRSTKDTGAGAAPSRGDRCRRRVSSRAAERSPSRSMAPGPPQRCPGRGGAGAAACSEPERPQRPAQPGDTGRRGKGLGEARADPAASEPGSRRSRSVRAVPGRRRPCRTRRPQSAGAAGRRHPRAGRA